MINQSLGQFFSDAIIGLKKIKEHSETKIEFFSRYGVFEDYAESTINSFPISEEYVNFEDNDVVRRCLKLVDDKLVLCSEDEFFNVQQWIIKYFDNAEEYPDIFLPCYNPNDNNLYQGTLSLTEIKKRNLYFTTVECDYSVAKYDDLEDKWIEVVMTMWDDGTYILNPDGYCDRCVKFFSQEEKDKLPPLPEEYKNAPFIKFDFKTESWYDSRTLDELKNSYFETVNARFNDLLDENARYYLNIGYGGISKILNISSNSIDTNSELYKTGVSEVSKVFYFNNDIEITEDFSIEELTAMYTNASNYIFGQRDAWLNLPNRLLLSSRYNLTTNNGWDKIIDKFEDWFNSVHG